MSADEKLITENARLNKEADLLYGAIKAQDEREHAAGERCGVPYELSGCDWPDAVAEAVLARDRKIAELEAELAETVKCVSLETRSAIDIAAERKAGAVAALRKDGPLRSELNKRFKDIVFGSSQWLKGMNAGFVICTTACDDVAAQIERGEVKP